MIFVRFWFLPLLFSFLHSLLLYDPRLFSISQSHINEMNFAFAAINIYRTKSYNCKIFLARKYFQNGQEKKKSKSSEGVPFFF